MRGENHVRRGRVGPGRRGASIAALLVVVSWAAGARAQSSSANYVLQQSTGTVGGGGASSLGYELTFSLGQEASVHASASDSFLLQAGLWSFLGTGRVPIVLAVDRSAVDEANCDLRWSGAEVRYDVFVGTDCSNVLDSFYVSTSERMLLDVAPPPASLVCFNVAPTGFLPTADTRRSDAEVSRP